jgi:phosphonate transport system ATP-binding protein
MRITLIVNLHQVDVAMKYSDRIIAVNKGKVVFNGSPNKLTTERISDIYGSEPLDMVANWG